MHPVPRGRGVLVIDDGATADLQSLAAAIASAFPRINLYYLTQPPGSLHGRAHRVGPPWPWPSVQRRYLRRLKIQAILVQGAWGGADALLRTAAEMGIALVGFGVPPGVPPERMRDLRLCFVPGGRRDEALARGVDAEALLCDPAPDEALARVSVALVSARPPGKRAHTFEQRMMRMIERPPFRWLVAGRFTALGSLEELAVDLGRPACILCLGNGPSSEDPIVAKLPHDALFRVNHAWLGRTTLDRPDVVFTGLRATLEACQFPTRFAFGTEAAARRMMLRSILLRRRFTYFTAERLDCVDFDAFLPYKPTNGAIMIATACALAPTELIVAGIDLFSDPRGAYPGAGGTPNAYAAAHDREVEAAFILDQLAAFPGKVTVIGEALGARWRARCEARGAPPRGR